jgi:hypothetical protein
MIHRNYRAAITIRALPTAGDVARPRLLHHGAVIYSGRRWTVLAKGFEIHVRGEVPPDLLDELEHLTAVEVPAETVLKGVLPDQSALFGVLARLQDLGLELIEVRRLGDV